MALAVLLLLGRCGALVVMQQPSVAPRNTGRCGGGAPSTIAHRRSLTVLFAEPPEAAKKNRTKLEGMIASMFTASSEEDAEPELLESVRDELERSASDGVFASETLQRAAATVAKIRVALDSSVGVALERIDRDSAIVKAVVEYVRRVTVSQTSRLLAAAADVAASNATLRDVSVMLKSGIDPSILFQGRTLSNLAPSRDARVDSARTAKLRELEAGKPDFNVVAGTARLASAVSDLGYEIQQEARDLPAGARSKKAAQPLIDAARQTRRRLGLLSDATDTTTPRIAPVSEVVEDQDELFKRIVALWRFRCDVEGVVSYYDFGIRLEIVDDLAREIDQPLEMIVEDQPQTTEERRRRADEFIAAATEEELLLEKKLDMLEEALQESTVVWDAAPKEQEAFDLYDSPSVVVVVVEDPVVVLLEDDTPSPKRADYFEEAGSQHDGGSPPPPAAVVKVSKSRLSSSMMTVEIKEDAIDVDAASSEYETTNTDTLLRGLDAAILVTEKMIESTLPRVIEATLLATGRASDAIVDPADQPDETQLLSCIDPADIQRRRAATDYQLRAAAFARAAGNSEEGAEAAAQEEEVV